MLRCSLEDGWSVSILLVKVGKIINPFSPPKISIEMEMYYQLKKFTTSLLFICFCLKDCQILWYSGTSVIPRVLLSDLLIILDCMYMDLFYYVLQ